MYRAVTFDIWSTLLENDVRPIETLERYLARFPDPPDARTFQSVWIHHTTNNREDRFYTLRDHLLMGMEAALAYFGLEDDPAEGTRLMLECWATAPPYPETEPVLRAICGAGLPILLVSNIDNREAALALDGTFLGTFDRITSEDVGAYKPDPRLLGAALDRLGLPPRSVLHVGDDPRDDVEGARRVGMDVYWVDRRGRASAGATYRGEDLRGVLEVLGLVPHDRRAGALVDGPDRASGSFP